MDTDMKRLALSAMVAMVALGLMGMPAFAATFTGAFLASTGEPTELAALYSSLPFDSGITNVVEHTLQLTTEVQVAQWAKLSFSGTKWTWFVRQPGEYYADSITVTLKSNGNVSLTADGFANPTYLDSNELDGVKQEIEIAYGAGSDPRASDFTGWFEPDEINGQELIVADSEALHEGISVKLWNKINVCECNSAGIYRNTGTLTMTLVNQMPWIDPETGGFNPSQLELGPYVTSDR